jgi:hypothetical protein
MLGFLIDNIFVVFGNQIFQQTVGISIGTNCAPFIDDLFLYSYEAEFIQKLLHEKSKNLGVAFNYPSTTINSIHMSNLYTPVNLKLKTPQNHLLLTNEMISILPLSTSHMFVATSHYTACGVYSILKCLLYIRSVFNRGRLLTDKLMLQGFLQSRLMSAFRKFYDRYNDLIYNYKLSLSYMLSDIFHTNSYTLLGTLYFYFVIITSGITWDRSTHVQPQCSTWRCGLSLRQLQFNYGISQIKFDEFNIYFTALRQRGLHQKKYFELTFLRQRCCLDFFIFFVSRLTHVNARDIMAEKEVQKKLRSQTMTNI